MADFVRAFSPLFFQHWLQSYSSFGLITSMRIDAGVDAVQFMLFLFVGGLISWLSEKRLAEALAAKRSDDLLHETGQHLEALVDASPLAIIVVNDKAQVQLWNPAAERIFGWLSAEVIGRQMPIVPRRKADHVSE